MPREELRQRASADPCTWGEREQQQQQHAEQQQQQRQQKKQTPGNNPAVRTPVAEGLVRKLNGVPSHRTRVPVGRRSLGAPCSVVAPPARRLE